MKRIAMLALLAAASLLLAGGAVLARQTDCSGGSCTGTKRADALFGTSGVDQINGRGGDDFIRGDLFADIPVGDDVLRGGAGDDHIVDFFGQGEDADRVFGGPGDDVVEVQEAVGKSDDSVDVVDCGPGRDIVFLDTTDTAVNCERVNRVD